jgi:hypothetical protein
MPGGLSNLPLYSSVPASIGGPLAPKALAGIGEALHVLERSNRRDPLARNQDRSSAPGNRLWSFSTLI